jgi:hypothetical protein
VTNFVPVNQARHGNMGWRPATNYAFAAKRNLVPLIASEYGKAAVSAPIAFVPEAEGYVAVVVFSLLPEDNLFVTPAGQWVGGYAPATLRAYPFQFAHVSGQQAILMVDEDSGLVFENDHQAERFFDADGSPSPAIGRVLEFLGQLDRERFVTQQATAALNEAGLIQPWPLSVTICGRETAVNGLHRIDEAALHALDDAEFCQLRRFSALSLAYAQLLSSGLVSVFERLSHLRRDLELREQRAPSVEEFLATNAGASLRFD